MKAPRMSNESQKTDNQTDPKPRIPYEAPHLIRWGTLTDLTEGGGGKMMEPGMGPTTRL